MLTIIAKYQVTCTLTSPLLMSKLLESPSIETTDLSSLRRCIVGGMAVSDALCQRINQLLPNGKALISYGVTEIAGRLTMNQFTADSASLGKLGCRLSARIRNIVGELCGPNEEGEICVWLDLPFVGYYNDKEATKAVMDADGWIRSGDLGRFDDDGNLHFVERLKDVIMYDCPTSPTEIEGILMGARGVANVCVVGIKINPISDWPTALVIRNDREDITEQEICDLVEGKDMKKKRLIDQQCFYFIAFRKTKRSKEITWWCFLCRHTATDTVGKTKAKRCPGYCDRIV